MDPNIHIFIAIFSVMGVDKFPGYSLESIPSALNVYIEEIKFLKLVIKTHMPNTKEI